jgi:hypothetical protein
MARIITLIREINRTVMISRDYEKNRGTIDPRL